MKFSNGAQIESLCKKHWQERIVLHREGAIENG